MMVYRKGTSKTYYLRLPGHRVIVSCATSLKTVADAMEDWAKDVNNRHDMRGVLEAIASGAIKFHQAYRLGEVKSAELLAKRAADALDKDLKELLDTWEAWAKLRTKGAASVPKYRTQIDAVLAVVFGDKPWKLSGFTALALMTALDALPGLSDATRNRYRAALSAFAKWLVRAGHMATNVLRDTEGYSEGRGRDMWYERSDAQRIIPALPIETRGIEALFAGTGMDLSDVKRLRRKDIDLDTLEVRCYGSKTHWRNRVVRITDAWTVPYIAQLCAGKLPEARLMVLSSKVMLKAHHVAVEALKLPKTTLHDWRHTYAVNSLRSGLSATVVAAQLGHADAHLVWTRYGRFVPNARDYSTTESRYAAPERREGSK